MSERTPDSPPPKGVLRADSAQFANGILPAPMRLPALSPSDQRSPAPNRISDSAAAVASAWVAASQQRFSADRASEGMEAKEAKEGEAKGVKEEEAKKAEVSEEKGKVAMGERKLQMI